MTTTARRLRTGVTSAGVDVAVAAAAVITGGCAASSNPQASCQLTHHHGGHALLLLEAQAVPSATLIPCVLPLPEGWSYGGSQVESGMGRFWLDSGRAGAHAVEVRLTRACDVAGAAELPLRSPPAGLRGYQKPAAGQPHAVVRYFVFVGGCVTEGFSFTRQTAPILFGQADRFLGFTPRSVYVHDVREEEGLTLCGAQAPPCPG
jgi:hypothetical protein